MYKFREDELIEEFRKYVESTYDQHYATDKYQATDIIIDSGHGTGFCLGNVIKYAKRYGKKGTSADARKDIMKVLHYALIQLYVHDAEAKDDAFERRDAWQYDLYPDYDPELAMMTVDGDGPRSNTLSDASIDSITPAEWNSIRK